MDKLVRVSLKTHERLCEAGKKNESFNTIIERLLDNNDEYEEIKGLILADKDLMDGNYEIYNSSKELFESIENDD